MVCSLIYKFGVSEILEVVRTIFNDLKHKYSGFRFNLSYTVLGNWSGLHHRIFTHKG